MPLESLMIPWSPQEILCCINSLAIELSGIQHNWLLWNQQFFSNHLFILNLTRNFWLDFTHFFPTRFDSWCMYLFSIRFTSFESHSNDTYGSIINARVFWKIQSKIMEYSTILNTQICFGGDSFFGKSGKRNNTMKQQIPLITLYQLSNKIII